MGAAHERDGNPKETTARDDSHQPVQPGEHLTKTNRDPERGPESPPQEKEEQIRHITGFRVREYL